jgi:Ser/Thr protein kinase RdoA (MazF antagonist)
VTGDSSGAVTAGRLRSHLETSYGIEVSGLAELDAGVFRVARADGPDWVARLFPAARPAGAAAGDAAVLEYLAGHGYRAERLAADEPVSRLGDRSVLVTGYVPGVPRAKRAETIRRLGGFIRLGALLGRLHTLPVPRPARPGGAWHHLAEGRPADEITAAARLLEDAADRVPAAERAEFDDLREQVACFDGGDGLPEALIHPDFVLANVVATAEPGMVLVDWTGAGTGPRLTSLAFLLFSAGARGLDRVDSAVAGYLLRVQPEPEELARLPRVIRVRPAIFDIWAFGHGRKTLAEARRAMAGTRELADAVAARAQQAFRDASRGTGR